MHLIAMLLTLTLTQDDSQSPFPEFERPSAQQQDSSQPLGIPSTRRASGTSWQPDSSGRRAIALDIPDWDASLQGNVFIGLIDQTTDEGDTALASMNWASFMAERRLFEGYFTGRAMVSLEPFTMEDDGYPQLFQTGEASGEDNLHDRQHPNDLFMEISGTYTQPLGNGTAWQVYAALVGEPALGPPAFTHRVSAWSDPMAPLGHHWQDTTHITHGVITGGYITSKWKVEGSVFNGREPDEDRTDLDLRRLDSVSGRLSWNPNSHWSFQASAGYLDSPEEANDDESLTRMSASAMRVVPFGDGGAWAMSFIWGRNNPEDGPATDAFLVEGDLDLDGTNTIFGRLEFVRKSGDDLGLDPEFQRDVFNVLSLSVGYVYNFAPVGQMVPSLGFRGSISPIDNDLEDRYGEDIGYGVIFYFRLWPAKSAR